MPVCISSVSDALDDGLGLPKPPSTRPVMATSSHSKGDKGCRLAGAWGPRGRRTALLGCSSPLQGGGRHSKMTGGDSQVHRACLAPVPGLLRGGQGIQSAEHPLHHAASPHQVGGPGAQDQFTSYSMGGL